MMKPFFFGTNFSTRYLVGSIVVLYGFYILKRIIALWIDFMRLRRAAEKIPGPPTNFLLGNALIFMGRTEAAWNILTGIGKIYSTYRLWLGPLLTIIVTKPEDIEIVLKSPNTETKSKIYKFVEPLLTNSIFDGHGPEMRSHKKLLVPIINGEHLKNYVDEFNVQVGRYIRTLRTKVNAEEFDMFEENQYCLADILYETILGIPGFAQVSRDISVVESFEVVVELAYQRVFIPWLHPSFLFNLSKCGKSCNASAKEIEKFLYKIIVDKRKFYTAKVRGEAVVEIPKPSVLDILMENVVETNKSYNDDEVKSDFAALSLGFYDTILGSLSFMMLMLAIHPEAQEKVREEILSVVGADGDITKYHLGNLKYTDMVIKESLRLFPIGPFLPREVTEDLELDEYTLPKGSTVVVGATITCRSEKYWHDPEKFIPERFSSENSKDRHPFTFTPFSSGSRRCVGSEFGTACCKVLIGQLIRSYKFSSTMTMQTLELRTRLSIRSQNGYKISIQKLSSSQSL